MLADELMSWMPCHFKAQSDFDPGAGPMAYSPWLVTYIISAREPMLKTDSACQSSCSLILSQIQLVIHSVRQYFPCLAVETFLQCTAEVRED